MLTIVQAPKTLTPVYNDNYIIVNSDQVGSKYNFYYLLEFYDATIGNLYPINPVISVKVLPNPLNQVDYTAGYGEFNLNRILNDRTTITLPTYDPSQIDYEFLDTAVKKYSIRVFEVYSNTADAIPTKQDDATIGDYYFLDGVLYNDQFYQFLDGEIDLIIDSPIDLDNPVKFLTNRPETTYNSHMVDLAVISNISNYAATSSLSTQLVFRQPLVQPLDWSASWDSGPNHTLDATSVGEYWSSKILALNGGYLVFPSNQSIYDYYWSQSGSVNYSGTFRRYLAGTEITGLTFELTTALTTFSSYNWVGLIQILGRQAGTNTWDVLTTADSSTGVTDYTIGFPDFTLTADYDELGIRFAEIPDRNWGIIKLDADTISYSSNTVGSPAIYVKAYNKLGNLIRIEQEPLDFTYKPQSIHIPDSYFIDNTIDYVKVFVAPLLEELSENIPYLTEIKTIKYKCKSLFGSKSQTLVWQNRLGGWDSYEYVVFQDKTNTISKEVFRTPTSKLTTVSSPQRRSTNIDRDLTKTLISDPVSKQEIEWLVEMLESKYIYEYSEGTLKPIILTTTEISEKPYNNILSQLRVSYRPSQIIRTK